jgi:hypothetical protein
MSRRLRRSLVAVGSVGSILLASLGMAGTASAAVVYVAELTGDAEVPGPGDPDGIGFAQLVITPGTGEICWTVIVEDIAAATAAHVHVGEAGVAGAIVVPIGTPDANGEAQDCSSGHDEAALQAIVDDPAGHYVNVHTGDFPDGAIRGQLEAIEINDIIVMKVACPAGLDTPEEVEAAGGAAACSPTGTVGSIGDPPPGYVWDPEPIEFDLQLTLDTPDESLTLDDASPGGAGDGVCNTMTLVCTEVSAYTWAGVTAGETTVTQVTAPDGYEFGWAEAGTITGDPVGFTIQGSSINFDSSGLVDQVLVVIYDIVPAGVTPTPTPTATPTPAPGATARPTVTPPATSTDGAVPVPSPIGDAGLMASIALLGGIGTIAIVGALRGRRTD